jgi:hypothetical protein
MRKYLPIILFFIPLAILVLILIYIESAKGEGTFESYKNSALLLGIVCVASAGVGYFMDMVYRGTLKSLMKGDATNEEKKVFPKIFAYFTLGLLFSFFFLWTKVDGDAATTKCFELYDDEHAIRHCIESGENIPDYDANF